MRKDGAETRKERIMQIAQYIQAELHKNKDSSEIILCKVVAHFGVDMGLSKPKIMEYLELLQENGQFEIDVAADRIRKLRV